MIKGINKAACPDTPDSEIQSTYSTLLTQFKTHTTQNISFRKTQLASLLRGINLHESEILTAIHNDLKTNVNDGYAGNLLVLKNDIKHTLKHLDSWVKPEKKDTPLGLWPGKQFTQLQARGVVLVIGSWNYPIQTLGPCVAAIAAGNQVIIKPSEHAPHVQNILKKVFSEFLDLRFYRVIEGGIQTGVTLTSMPFDLICFTGSTYVGKIIAKAASANLTPCILELGGKCPTVVDHTADLDLAAKRIISGKFFNCGQTCVAPDYLYIHAGIKDKFIGLLKEKIVEFYGKNPKNSHTYSRLIHGIHTKRVAQMLESHEDKVIHGDIKQIDIQNNYIPPILLLNPNKDTLLMKEEIFGPILPIFVYNTPMEVISYINQTPRPLAVYYYGEPDQIVSQRLQERTTSGAFLTNDQIVHFAHMNLPFGGIGDSGYGTTHGYDGFLQMSHKKAVLKRPNSAFMDLDVRYPDLNGSGKESLRKFKKVEFFFDYSFEGVLRVLGGVGGVIGVFLLFWVLKKLGVLSVDVSLFPGRGQQLGQGGFS